MFDLRPPKFSWNSPDKFFVALISSPWMWLSLVVVGVVLFILIVGMLS